MIAEKILDDNRIAGKGSWLTVEGINRAMQSYADFYYWLGKEGWEVVAVGAELRTL